MLKPVFVNTTKDTACILLVDDDIELLKALTKVLEKAHYEVVPHSDARGAMEYINSTKKRFDLVVTDVDMPRLNGMDLRARLLEERPGIKVIVMSGSDMSEILRQNVNLPFLPKPFDGDALLARVKVILGDPISTRSSVRNASRTSAPRQQRISTLP